MLLLSITFSLISSMNAVELVLNTKKAYEVDVAPSAVVFAMNLFPLAVITVGK